MSNKSNVLLCAKKNHDILKNRKQKRIDNFKRPNQKLIIKIKKRIVKHMKKECLKCNYDEFESTINTPISKMDYSIFKKELKKNLGKCPKLS